MRVALALGLALPPFPPFFFFNDTATTEIYTLSLHDALPISCPRRPPGIARLRRRGRASKTHAQVRAEPRVPCGASQARRAPRTPPPRAGDIARIQIGRAHV